MTLKQIYPINHPFDCTIDLLATGQQTVRVQELKPNFGYTAHRLSASDKVG